MDHVWAAQQLKEFQKIIDDFYRLSDYQQSEYEDEQQVTGYDSFTRAPNSILEPLLGVGDAWSFVHEADCQWKTGNRGWAVEFEEGLPRA